MERGNRFLKGTEISFDLIETKILFPSLKSSKFPSKFKFSFKYPFQTVFPHILA